ncbi:hybrid sensor histidine kinase/response regulator [Roseomonas marmotae]|uniref:histidine kinase n=1 Tax=Roseomonas marmotae TaxID=2768161 RepID=A0ABS3KCW1_9PROT|nr:response regulator [Roseomonas marmotae]MBO1074196.1 response regulator [Roseomonas marmotae]QTI78968.1 response regulator [Roseomonas marmotae]
MSDLRRELLAAFDAEHKEHLGAIRAALDAAERGEQADLRDIFRRAHSLKGAARAVDLPVVEEVAHRLEAVLARVAEGAMALDARVAAGVQVGLDGIEGYVAALSGGAAPPVPAAAIAALDALLGQGAPAGSAPSGQPQPPSALSPAPGPAAEPAAPAPAGPVEYLRVNAEQIEALAGAVHTLSEEVAHQGGLEAELRDLDASLSTLRRNCEAMLRPGQNQAPALSEVVRGLDGLSRRVSRLARQQHAATFSAEAAAQRVREQVEAIALVPAETVLGPLGRMARELARELGQDVAVRLEGMEIQADRRVLQTLKDPVLHLLRNAIGHGVERPEERRARGKPERAEVVLRLSGRGGLLVLSVIDDGRGPDLPRIEATGIRQGLLPDRAPDAPPPPSDRLLSLVFEPGFSTAAEVDRLSGRGMGLSVVAEAARRLRGGVLMRPRRRGGTVVEIAVPFSAARQKVLLVEAGGLTYGLPSHGVERLLRLPLAAVESVEGRPVTRIAAGGRDVIAPVIALSALLGSSQATIPVEAGHVNAVLLRRGERHCALAVDAMRDVRTLLVDSLDAPGLDTELLSGIAPREGEAPALVLSPEGLVGRWLRDEGHLASGTLGLAPAEERASATILVVDDSITTRTLEKSILEAQGYRVLLSVDGLEALNLLRSGDALVDLVVADVEMPRMDGYALLQAIKTDPRLAPLPVILMTSRASPEDVRRGLDLGAGAYIAKQKFDQRELLATIGQML